MAFLLPVCTDFVICGRAHTRTAYRKHYLLWVKDGQPWFWRYLRELFNVKEKETRRGKEIAMKGVSNRDMKEIQEERQKEIRVRVFMLETKIFPAEFSNEITTIKINKSNEQLHA
jgi:hypothetical protein